MPQLGTQIEGDFFKVFVDGWQQMAQQVESDLTQYFREQVALGRTPQDILAELKASREGDLGLIKQITGNIKSRIDFGSNTIFQLASNDPLKNVAEKFKWTLNPSAEHCDSCRAQAEMGDREWGDIPYPTTQPTIGKTNCTRYCACSIEPAEVKNVA